LLSFPLSLDSNWQSVCEQPVLLNEVSERLRSWLLEANSLTARLKQGCGQLNVEVLSERLAEITPSQARLFSGSATIMWCREVILRCDNKPVVYAQSWIPESLKQMTQLGTTPLGEVLFQEPRWQRGDLQVTLLAESLAPLITQLGNVPTEAKAARRSIFSQNGIEMLVCEVFLMEPMAP
jgi:chorismate--pyruvate lyase